VWPRGWVKLQLYSSMTAALEGGEWSAARSGRTLTPGKKRYPFYRRLGGLQGRSGQAENLVPTGIRSRTVQPVAQSLYRLSYPAHGNNISRPKNGTRLGTWGIPFNSTICPFLIRMSRCVKTRDVFTNILLGLKPIDAIDSIPFSYCLGKLKFTYRTGVHAQFKNCVLKLSCQKIMRRNV